VSDEPGTPLPEVGLCSACRHARVQASARGGRFWRCARADAEPGFQRYPPLPVRACGGFERAERDARLARSVTRRDPP
jgi:hypothetical protein